jgi:hypothetical protein
MAAKTMRVNVALERALYDALGLLARREGASLSTKARDLLRDALEANEDRGLAEIAMVSRADPGAEQDVYS